MPRILVVEDNTGMREMLATVLREGGYEVTTAGAVAEGLAWLARESFSLILSDLQLPDRDGIDFCREARPAGIPFLILTAFGSIEKAVAAVKEGAADFLTKPVDPDYLRLVIEKNIEASRLLRENEVLRGLVSLEAERHPIIGRDPAFLAEAEKLRQVAATDTPVIVVGESGTGKELFARAIHYLSPRRFKPFLAVNSAAIPENLLENELFGHERGSYTGAHGRQVGLLEQAQGGTFFFDEIGDLPSSLQGKLLRVLEEKRIHRIGGDQAIALDLRFVFATNQDLAAAVAAGRFRRDLYFRIQVFPLHLSPLRQRPGDIDLLAGTFLNRFAHDMKRKPLRLTPEALAKLARYPWPGNIRELQNVMERAAILTPGETVTAAEIDLPDRPLAVPEEFDLQGSLPEAVARATALVERRKIAQALAASGGHRGRAASALGISTRTLQDKIHEYGLATPD